MPYMNVPIGWPAQWPCGNLQKFLVVTCYTAHLQKGTFINDATPHNPSQIDQNTTVVEMSQSKLE